MTAAAQCLTLVHTAIVDVVLIVRIFFLSVIVIWSIQYELSLRIPWVNMCVCVLNNNNSGRSIAIELIVLCFAIEWIARLRSMRSLVRTVPAKSMNGRMNTSVIIAAERLHVCITIQTHNQLHINSSCLHSFYVAFAKCQYQYSLVYVYRLARNNHMEGFDDAMHATIFMWSNGFFQLYGSVG